MTRASHQLKRLSSRYQNKCLHLSGSFQLSNKSHYYHCLPKSRLCFLTFQHLHHQKLPCLLCFQKSQLLHHQKLPCLLYHHFLPKSRLSRHQKLPCRLCFLTFQRLRLQRLLHQTHLSRLSLRYLSLHCLYQYHPNPYRTHSYRLTLCSLYLYRLSHLTLCSPNLCLYLYRLFHLTLCSLNLYLYRLFHLTLCSPNLCLLYLHLHYPYHSFLQRGYPLWSQTRHLCHLTTHR